MDKVRLGIIGYGNMGSGHTKNILDGKCPEIELTAIADRKEELIKSDACDAILIAVPHYQHPGLAMMGFDNGKHVMCEKPAGVYTLEVRKMNEAAANSDRTFAMMFNQRTNCVYRKMHEMVHGGELGEIKRVNWIITDWYRTQSYYDSGAWRATCLSSGRRAAA